MKLTTRIIALLLVLCMAVPVFVSCGDKKEEPKDRKDMTEEELLSITETDEDPHIEAIDYDGYDFCFITNEGEAYNCGYIEYSEEEEGEILNDAIYRRNMMMYDKYNVNVKQLKTTDIISSVRSQVMSGQTEFDVILASCSKLATMAQENLLLNLLDIERFDMTKSYWDQNAKEQLLIGKKLYFTNCALNISTIGFAVFFNKKLIEDYNLTSPYEYMANDNWTVDTWAQLVKSISKDLDGDGNMTEMDQYGTLSEHHNPRMFLYGFGIRATTNDETGYPVPTLMANKDKTVTAYEKLKNVFSDNNCCYCMTCSQVDPHGYTHKYNYLRYLFTQDLYLFHYTSANGISQFTDMESEFGIIPFPKYDNTQESYKTMYPYNNLLFAMPSTLKDARLERAANLVEDMNYMSSFIIIPAWFDTLLTRRYTRDDESEASMSIIRDNCVYDIGLYYNFGDIRSSVLDVDIAGSNISRNYARIERGLSASIKKAYTNFTIE